MRNYDCVKAKQLDPKPSTETPAKQSRAARRAEQQDRNISRYYEDMLAGPRETPYIPKKSGRPAPEPARRSKSTPSVLQRKRPSFGKMLAAKCLCLCFGGLAGMVVDSE